MTERKKFWERAAPTEAVEKHQSRHSVNNAKARARIHGRDHPETVDSVTADRRGKPQ